MMTTIRKKLLKTIPRLSVTTYTTQYIYGGFDKAPFYILVNDTKHYQYMFRNNFTYNSLIQAIFQGGMDIHQMYQYLHQA
jgi:hypothetical protein